MSGRLACWLLVPLLTAALVYRVGEASRRHKASRILEVVKTVTYRSSQRARLTQGVIDRNVKLLREAESLDPADVRLPIARGGQYMRARRWEAAIRSYDHALTLEPRGEIFANLGRAQLNLGNRDAADEAFRKAILLDHNQRKRLSSYLRKPVPQPSQQAAPEAATGASQALPKDLIFSSSFESGDFSGWKRFQGRKGRRAEEPETGN